MAFTHCVQQMEEAAEAWTNIGAVHMKREDYRLSIGPLTQALKSQPDSWRIRENLVLSYLKTGG